MMMSDIIQYFPALTPNSWWWKILIFLWFGSIRILPPESEEKKRLYNLVWILWNIRRLSQQIMILKSLHITELLSLCEAKTVTAANPAPAPVMELLMADNNLKNRENCLDGNFAKPVSRSGPATHTVHSMRNNLRMSCDFVWLGHESMSIESLLGCGRSVLRSCRPLHATSYVLWSLWAGWNWDISSSY